jgi:hypothetical protein
VLTVRAKVTDRMLIFGRRHLQTMLAEYEARYNGRGPHRSRQLRPSQSDHPDADLSRKHIQRRIRAGGRKLHIPEPAFVAAGVATSVHLGCPLKGAGKAVVDPSAVW